jgi:hypothetical protein
VTIFPLLYEKGTAPHTTSQSLIPQQNTKPVFFIPNRMCHNIVIALHSTPQSWSVNNTATVCMLYLKLGPDKTMIKTKKKTKLHHLSPRANYTDRVTAACRWSDCQLVWIEGATWSAWRIPLAVFSRFSRQEPLLFYQVSPQLYSRGWVDPVPDPLFFFLVVNNSKFYCLTWVLLYNHRADHLPTTWHYNPQEYTFLSTSWKSQSQQQAYTG